MRCPVNKDKWCPTVRNTDTKSKGGKTGCPWWDEVEEKCAVLLLAVSQNMLLKIEQRREEER